MNCVGWISITGCKDLPLEIDPSNDYSCERENEVVIENVADEEQINMEEISFTQSEDNADHMYTMIEPSSSAKTNEGMYFQKLTSKIRYLNYFRGVHKVPQKIAKSPRIFFASVSYFA